MEGTLILVDIQNDFLPGGALAVHRGDEVIAVANRLIPLFPRVLASQDWHPPNHVSFAANHPGTRIGDIVLAGGIPQVLWPVHCVQGTPGAELSPALDLAGISQVFRKGTDPLVDSYSAFMDNGRLRSTGLGEFLRQHGSGPLFIMGLATDYCVKHTVLDACAMGWETNLIEDGCRGVESHPGDCDRAIGEMRRAGAAVIRSGIDHPGGFPEVRYRPFLELPDPFARYTEDGTDLRKA